ncbi:hypothetical protein FNW02_28850 [Komarekiella sp. 'clone 1']|uniref:Uncharacterized protein n=1 Tax=Komarekiella delphini-convector SJRDD-AB1 TaxID=2593771 RepID=A0AA40T331_9NOST|nr:hypothetical protein [Komarekiella delphini-convector]MBD6619717.1 hypothetical protein [Komarekiella delphini-convector SJRDD-AB1]
MSEHFKGDRVFAFRGEYQGKSGEAIGYQNTDFQTQKGCLVKLDENASTVCIPERDLEAENLSPQEIDTEITKLKKQVESIAHQMPKKIVKEIPEHLTYLQQALKSKNQSESRNEYHYISEELARVINPDFVSKNISLKKIQHCCEKLLKS